MRIRFTRCILFISTVFVMYGCGLILGSIGGPQSYPHDMEYYTYSWDVKNESSPPRPYISNLDITTTYFNYPTIFTGFPIMTIKSATFKIHGLSQEKLTLLESKIHRYGAMIRSLDKNLFIEKPVEPYIWVEFGGNHIKPKNFLSFLNLITQTLDIAFAPASAETYERYKNLVMEGNKT